MKPWLRLSIVVVFALSVSLLASCGGDDDGGTKPNANEPPALESPPIVQQVDFHSTNSTAQTAQSLVQAQLGMATALASTSEGILAPAQAADWNHSGDCWSWSYTEDQCTLTYEVCETEDGYDWTVTFNGNCGGDPVHDWLAMDGHTNADATEGVLHFYNEGETTPGLSVTWTRAEDDLSGTWNFYEGEVDEANLTAVLNWEKISDSSGHMDWVWLEQAKWELDYADNGGSGTMEMYEWSEGSWELNMEIVWNMDGTGHWTIYENGQVTETTSW